jgi:hypothetical protein
MTALGQETNLQKIQLRDCTLLDLTVKNQVGELQPSYNTAVLTFVIVIKLERT